MWWEEDFVKGLYMEMEREEDHTVNHRKILIDWLIDRDELRDAKTFSWLDENNIYPLKANHPVLLQRDGPSTYYRELIRIPECWVLMALHHCVHYPEAEFLPPFICGTYEGKFGYVRYDNRILGTMLNYHPCLMTLDKAILQARPNEYIHMGYPKPQSIGIWSSSSSVKS